MNITETLNEGLKRGYKITLKADEIDRRVNQKLKEAQPSVEIKGFRKGKVPMPMLKRQFGASVMGEVIQEDIDGALKNHFETSGDKPAKQPDVKMLNQELKEGQDVEVDVNYETLPLVPEIDLSGIQLEKLNVAIEDADIEEALERLAAPSQEFDAKEGAAEKGDQVILDFVGKIDDEAFENGSGEKFPLTLGSASFIPGFEEQLIGVQSGDEKAVEVTFPENYSASELAGKAAVFECKIHEVKSPKPFEMNDEFAQKMGAETVDALKDNIKSRFENEYSDISRMILKRNLMDALDETLSFELPSSMVEDEAAGIAHNLWHEENPDVTDHNHPEIETKEEHRTLAIRRVKVGIYLADVGKQRKIELTEPEIQQAVAREVRNYPGQEKEFIDYVTKTPAILERIAAPVFEDKVIDALIEDIELTSRDVSKDELQEAFKELENM